MSDSAKVYLFKITMEFVGSLFKNKIRVSVIIIIVTGRLDATVTSTVGRPPGSDLSYRCAMVPSSTEGAHHAEEATILLEWSIIVGSKTPVL